MRKHLVSGLAVSALGVTLTAMPVDRTASAQGTVTKEGLVNALSNPDQTSGRTRSLSGGTPGLSSKQRSFIDQLANRKTRQITVEERTELTKIVEGAKRPSIDLEIYFDFNSAEIRPDSVKTVTTLGEALSDAGLKSAKFMIAGHTDAKGTDAYNQHLSQLRSHAVRQYLIKHFKIDESRLIAVGFGEEKLKNKSDPFAGENRRVQIVNLAD